MAQFSTLLEHQRHFHSDLICMKHLEQKRWGGTPTCPHCGSTAHYRVKTRFKSPDLADYRDFVCKDCRRKYNTLTGTIYESSKLSLRVWFAAVYLITAHKKGISSHQLSRDLGVTQKTAWFLLHRIRAMIGEVKEQEKLEGTVQADETFVGGKNKNRHWDKKVPKAHGRSHVDKVPVAGLLQQNEYEFRPNKHGEARRIIAKPSQVRLRVIPDTGRIAIHSFVRDCLQQGSILVSDEWRSYRGLGDLCSHHVVDHSRGQYVDKDGNTSNAMEGFWSQLKRGINGIYHRVSPKHLQRYADEFGFRHNHRLMDNGERFDLALTMSKDVRLSYLGLTG